MNKKATMQREKVGPKEAQAILDKNREICESSAKPENYRGLRANHVEELKNAILKDRFLDTGDPIRICVDGSLGDGQHRLHAILDSGKTVEVWVMRDADPDIIKVIDTGMKRTAGDYLRYAGKGDNKDAAIARSLYALVKKTVGNFHLDNFDVEEIVERNREAIDWARDNLPKKTQTGINTGGAAVWAAFVLAYPVCPAACQSLVERLVSQSGLRSQDNAKALSAQLVVYKTGSPTERLDMSLKTLKAIHAEMSNIQMKLLRADESLVDDFNKLRPHAAIPTAAKPIKRKKP